MGGHNKGKHCDRKTGNYKTRAGLIHATKRYKVQGLSNEVIALRVGVHKSTVQRLLNGDPQTATITGRAIRNKTDNTSEQLERGDMEKLDSLWVVRGRKYAGT